jgi:uncharacterized membrane protein (UPF0127 family)
VSRMFAVICIITAVSAASASLLVIDNFPSNQTEEHEGFLKQIEYITNDKSLQAKITVNSFQLTADLAINNDQQSKGLSVKNTLKENEGMLFVFKQPSRQGFWMKDMKFPIDIIWLDANSTVVHIENNLKPCVSVFSCHVYVPDKNSLYVLETTAGFSQRHNVKIGTHVDLTLIR